MTLSRFALHALAVLATVSLLHQVRADEFASGDEVRAHNRYIEAVIDDAAARYGMSPRLLRCVGFAESKRWTPHGVIYDPFAVGDRGASHGLFQIHEDGLYRLFLSLGYTNRFDSYQASDFASWAISKGLGTHWTTFRFCRG